MNIGFYVSSIDGTRKALMAGPFPTKEAAEAKVSDTREACYALDARAWFRAWGTARLETPGELPIGNYDKFLAAQGAK